MATIYFPSIDAEATVLAEAAAHIKSRGTASVCDRFSNGAYIGRVQRIKWTAKRPADWSRRADVRLLKHIPDGGFAYEIR